MRASGHAEHTGEASSRHLKFRDSAAHKKIRFFIFFLFFAELRISLVPFVPAVLT